MIFVAIATEAEPGTTTALTYGPPSGHTGIIPMQVQTLKPHPHQHLLRLRGHSKAELRCIPMVVRRTSTGTRLMAGVPLARSLRGRISTFASG